MVTDLVGVGCGIHTAMPQRFHDADELRALGMDRLKEALEALGLKCGGTLEQRADRLFSVKGKAPEEIAPKLKVRDEHGPCLFRLARVDVVYFLGLISSRRLLGMIRFKAACFGAVWFDSVRGVRW